MRDSFQVETARRTICKLNDYTRMVAEAQISVATQAKRVAEAITAVAQKDPSSLNEPIVLAWVSHWAYTGLPLLGVELPGEVLDVITAYDKEKDTYAD